MPGARMFITVAIMLIDPMMEDTPRMWIAKIKKVTEGAA
jgi:hypothetical protein